MTHLAALLAEKIQKNGDIPFEDFMEQALYHPEYGYYTNLGRVGRSGDFYTSASVGTLWGELLARFILTEWKRIGSPEKWDLIEQGANDGALARDILISIKHLHPIAFSGVTLHLIEPLETAKQHQQLTLKQQSLDTKLIHWNSLLDVPPQHWNGIFYCNELPDSFPVRRLVYKNHEWMESWVTLQDGAFSFKEYPISLRPFPKMDEFLAKLSPLDGYTTEINLKAHEWIQSLANVMHKGVILIVDYGLSFESYYDPNRKEGTLRAFSNHRQCIDLLGNPGEQDLTTDVEFSSLIKTGESAGLKLIEWTDQHRSLVKIAEPLLSEWSHIIVSSYGLRETQTETKMVQQKMRQFQSLMHPEHMGSRFQWLTFSSGTL